MLTRGCQLILLAIFAMTLAGCDLLEKKKEVIVEVVVYQALKDPYLNARRFGLPVRRVCLEDYSKYSVSGVHGFFPDVVEGANVTILDGTGNVLAMAKLGANEDLGDCQGFICRRSPGCTRTALVEVPAGKKFYQVKVGTRSAVRYSEEDFLTDGKVTLSIGRL